MRLAELLASPEDYPDPEPAVDPELEAELPLLEPFLTIPMSLTRLLYPPAPEPDLLLP